MTNYTHWFIRARLKTRQLLLIVALAEEGNIHRAAQVLNMTQPAASKLLKDLEDVLEVPLFDRLPRGMRPTWYGETMIRHARVALASLNQAHDELMALKAGGCGAGQHRCDHRRRGWCCCRRRSRTSSSANTQTCVSSLEIETSPVLLERLEQGKLDLLVARLFAEHDKTNVRYEALTEEPVCALVRPGHPLLGMTGLGLRDLVSAGWIVPPAGSVLRHRFELMFQEEGARAAAECDRDGGAAFHHTHAAAKRHGGRARRPMWRATTRRMGSWRCCLSRCPVIWMRSASSRERIASCRRRPR